jgi:hypothetical protein
MKSLANDYQSEFLPGIDPLEWAPVLVLAKDWLSETATD